MKIRIYIISLVLLLSAGCISDKEPVSPRSGDISFAISFPGSSARASENGVDALNENTIESLDVFIFNNTGTVTEHYERITPANQFTGTGTHSVTLSATKSAFNPGEFHLVYVIANLDDHFSGGVPTQGFQFRDLMDMITTTASTFDPDDVQDNFLMDGYIGAILNDGTPTGLTVPLNLLRAAAKFRVAITYASGYGPAAGKQATKKIINWSCATGLSYVGNYKPGFNLVPESVPTIVSTITTGAGTTVPGFMFYTYDNDWIDDPDKETYVLLNVPQTGKDDNYYKIPVNYRLASDLDKNPGINNLHKIKRNTLYDISVVIDRDGSTSPALPIEVDGMVWVRDWVPTPFDADLADQHWLFVREDDIKMVNIQTYTVPYSADLPVTIENLTARFLNIDFDGNETEGEYLKTGPDAEPEYPAGKFPVVEIDPVDFNLTIKSLVPINYVPLTIEFDVTNGQGLTKHVKVTQYPLQYITSKRSTGNVVPEWMNEDPDQDNFNLFTITTLNTSKYTIGDPTFGKNYTDTTSVVDNMISPSFVIASHYGAYSGSAEWATSYKRCQEFGEDVYRSGWRMPTLAELELINAIQADDNSAIKKLFHGRGYWVSKKNWYYKMSKWSRPYFYDVSGLPTELRWEDQVPGPAYSPTGLAVSSPDGVPDIWYESGRVPGGNYSTSGGIRCIHDVY